MNRFYSAYLKAVNDGIENIKIRVETDRSLPAEGRTMKWDLAGFMRLDQDLLPSDGASPQAQITFQQVSSTLSEYTIRRLLNGEPWDKIQKAIFKHAELMFDHHLKKFGDEIKEEVKNEESSSPLNPAHPTDDMLG